MKTTADGENHPQLFLWILFDGQGGVCYNDILINYGKHSRFGGIMI